MRHSIKRIFDNDRLAKHCGSLHTAISRTYPAAQVIAKSTVIAVEADEQTPLFKGSKSYGGTAASVNSNDNSSEYGADSSYGSEDDISSLKKGVGGIIEADIRKQRMHCCACIQMMAFVLILASACVIATYLLIAESRLPTLQFSLDLVHRDLWSNVSTPLSNSLNLSNVINIAIMQTGGVSCEAFEKCLQILHELQKQYQAKDGSAQAIPFNFLIGEDRHAYEARGWNYESGLPFVSQNITLVIAFIGNYSTLAPSSVQLRSTLSLIAESVRQKKLQRQYKIFGLQNQTNSRNDGKALFDAISQWKQFAGILQLN